MYGVVWKVRLEVSDFQTVMLPWGARALSVGVQHGEVMLWAEVDPDERMAEFPVFIQGTGHNPQSGRGPYVGSFMLDDGKFVGHVFVED